jgi:hypothetical protein
MTAIDDVVRTLDELIELGGERLRRDVRGIEGLRAVAGEAAEADGARYRELVHEMEGLAQGLYGGYGSFRDWGIGGPDGSRFECLKNDLDRQLDRL